LFFTFPEDARWDAERQAVEFGVEIGEYRGVVEVLKPVFKRGAPDMVRARLKGTSSATQRGVLAGGALACSALRTDGGRPFPNTRRRSH